MKQLEDFAEKILHIDKHNLDEEWLAQPEMFFWYAEKLADARADVERAKANLQVTAADLDSQIRERPEDFGIVKTTEAALKAAVLCQDDYREAQRVLIEAEHTSDLFDAAVKALDQRKRALENLVSLHGQSYFATPTVKGPHKEAAREHFDDVRKKKLRRTQP